MDQLRGIVIFGDIVNSRNEPAGATAWLRTLTAQLNAHYADVRLAPWDFTQGDELQGLLRPGADPLDAVLRGGLAPAGRPMRWAIVAGAIEAGEGSATQRTGPAFVSAREAVEALRIRREGLHIETGDPESDALLVNLAPVLAEMISGLTDRQREVARLAILEERRQADIAAMLNVTRATISVTFRRAGMQSLTRMIRAVRTILATGMVEAERLSLRGG